jgi:hypothetical protein
VYRGVRNSRSFLLSKIVKNRENLKNEYCALPFNSKFGKGD